MIKYKIALAAVLAALAVLVISSISSSSSVRDSNEKIIVLTSSNTIVLNAEVDGDSVGAVLEQANILDSSVRGGPLSLFGSGEKPIYLFLNTPGGDIGAGLELIEGLNGLKRPVNSITAFSASMGMQIAQSLNGERYIMRHGIMMSHRGTGQFAGQFGGEEPSQLSNRYRIQAQRLKEMDERTVSRSKGKQTLESYRKAYNSELWVTGREAVDQGYADSLVQVRCDETLAGVTTHSVSFLGFPILFDMDNCPINSSPRNIRLGLLTNRGHMTVDEFGDKKGGFGPLCLQEAVLDNTRVCSLDTTLTYDKIEQIKRQFIDSFENKRNNVIPMTM